MLVSFEIFGVIKECADNFTAPASLTVNCRDRQGVVMESHSVQLLVLRMLRSMLHSFLAAYLGQYNKLCVEKFNLYNNLTAHLRQSTYSGLLV